MFTHAQSTGLDPTADMEVQSFLGSVQEALVHFATIEWLDLASDLVIGLEDMVRDLGPGVTLEEYVQSSTVLLPPSSMPSPAVIPSRTPSSGSGAPVPVVIPPTVVPLSRSIRPLPASSRLLSAVAAPSSSMPLTCHRAASVRHLGSPAALAAPSTSQPVPLTRSSGCLPAAGTSAGERPTDWETVCFIFSFSVQLAF